MGEFIEKCRTCLSHNAKILLSITSIVETNSRILDNFEKYLHIKMTPDDNFPTTICVKCFNKLIEVRKFYLQCLDSENYLKSKYQIKISNSSEQLVSEQNKVDESTLDVEQNFDITPKITDNKNLSLIEKEFNEEIVELDLIDSDKLKTEDNNESNELGNFSFYDISEELTENETIKNQKIKENFTCKICNEGFTLKENYEIHMKRHGENKRDPHKSGSGLCPICGKFFEQKRKLSLHIYNHNNIMRVSCTICNKAFKAQHYLNVHMNKHTGAKPYKCNVCNKCFVAPSSLRIHKALHDGKKFDCPMCDTKLASKPQLKRHMRKHTNERPYTCPQCPKTYREGTALKYHMNIHTGEKPFKCNVCSESFATPSILRTHKALHDGKKFDYPMCDTKLAEKAQLKRHMRKHTNERSYACSQCPKTYKERTYLKYHMNIHTGEKPFKCNVCSKSFAAPSNLRTHKALHDGKKFDYPMCDTKLTGKAQLKRHMRKHSNEQNRPYACPQCPKTYKGITALKIHLAKHASFDSENYLKSKYQIKISNSSELVSEQNKVDDSTLHVEQNFDIPKITENKNLSLIEKEFNEENVELDLIDRDKLKTEDNNESNDVGNFAFANISEELPEKETIKKQKIEESFTCKICNEGFTLKTKYEIHMKRHGKNKREPHESLICPICGKLFEQKRKLTSHIYRHNNIMRVSCTICNKAFKAQHYLNVHMNKHTGEKPYKCNVCNKCFVAPSSLRIHKALHDGKKFGCPMCDIKLAEKAQLKRHMRKHTNERPYACPQCPKTYKGTTALKYHMNIHTGEKPFKCNVCNKSFAAPSSLRTHKALHDVSEQNKVDESTLHLEQNFDIKPKITENKNLSLIEKEFNEENVELDLIDRDKLKTKLAEKGQLKRQLRRHTNA